MQKLEVKPPVDNSQTVTQVIPKAVTITTEERAASLRAGWRTISYRPNFYCVNCGGFGFVHPVDEYRGIDYGKVIPCEAPNCLRDSIRAFKSGIRLENAGITAKGQTFDNFSPIRGTEQACKYSKELASGKSTFAWLAIYGGTGNGKTHLCNAIAKVIAERGFNVELINSVDLFAKLRKGINDHTIEDRIQHYKDLFFLLVDDWGVEYGTDFEMAKFDEIMTVRFASLLPTVITTNKDKKDFPGRILSRFEDERFSRLIKNNAPDYRVKR